MNSAEILRILSLLPFIAPALNLSAQVTDTLSIPEIEIKDHSYHNTEAYKVTTIDSASISINKTASVGNLIKQYSPVFINSYGSGSLATSTFRGTNARHTLISWNEMPINSPALGLFDLSILPAGFAGSVDILYGGSSTYNGSGGLGGAINLRNEPEWNRSFSGDLYLFSGSYNDQRSGINADYGNQQIRGQTNIFYSTADNDFSYPNIAKKDTPIEQQNHAYHSQLHLRQSVYWRPSAKRTFSISGWWMKTYREIPPLITSPDTIAEMNYDALLIKADWKEIFKKGIFKARSGFVYDINHYTDTLTGIDARHLTKTWRNRLEVQYQWTSNFYQETGLDADIETARSDGYEDEALRRRIKFSLYNRFKWEPWKDFKINLFLQEMVYDNKLSPLIYSAGVSRSFANKTILVNGSFSHNFQLPALHDLYWFPQGNPDLKPEKGWTAETGLTYLPFQRKTFLFEVNITAYYSRIQDMIQWLPDASGNWQPDNIKNVKNRGIEAIATMKLKTGKINWSGKNIYSFTKASDMGGDKDNFISKQLIYVPEHQFNSIIRAGYQGYFVIYEHEYTGRRYITSDNEWYMPPYYIVNLKAGKTIDFSSFKVTLQGEVKNLWGRPYQAVAYRPMPGRNFGVSGIIRFIK